MAHAEPPAARFPRGRRRAEEHVRAACTGAVLRLLEPLERAPDGVALLVHRVRGRRRVFGFRLVMHWDEPRREVVVGTSHRAALILLVVVVALVRALDADAEGAVPPAAACPQLASRGDEEGVVAPRGERRDRLVDVVEVLDEAGPRDAAVPPRGGGEGDVAEPELAVAARAPRPHAPAVRQAHRVAATRDGSRHVHAPQRLQALKRTGVVEVSVPELAVAAPPARPQPATLAHDHGVVRARRDLRHLDARHRVHLPRDVNLDRGPPAVAQLAARSEPPRHEHAVGIDRRAVRRAAGHALDRGGILDARLRAEGDRRGSRGVVVAALPELAVEAAAERVHRAPARLRQASLLPRRSSRRGGDDLHLLRSIHVLLLLLLLGSSIGGGVELARRLRRRCGRCDSDSELVSFFGNRSGNRLGRRPGVLILGQRHDDVAAVHAARRRAVAPLVLRRVHRERRHVRDVASVAERPSVGPFRRHALGGGQTRDSLRDAQHGCVKRAE